MPAIRFKQLNSNQLNIYMVNIDKALPKSTSIQFDSILPK
jgi:hypothetical protein